MKQPLCKVKDSLYTDIEIKSFCRNNNISDEQFLNAFGKFTIQMENNKICENCDGTRCRMEPAGMRTELVYDENKVNLRYVKCKKYQGDHKGSIDMMHFPQSKCFNNQQLFTPASRLFAFKHMNDFKTNYIPGEFTKGIYLHGIFGTGKTFLMLRMASDLAAMNIGVMVAYYPDLVRFIKSSLATNDLENIINKMKYIEVLMLDDIGAENNSGFIRDEVLGPVLQFRLYANKPVFMTSNLDLDLLRKHFMESREQIDAIKSDRIIERIRHLMHIVELDDRNYRL